MLDTNVVDKLVADHALVGGLQRLVGERRIRLLFTHLQIDEIMECPESNPKRQHLVDLMARLPAERVPTYGFIVGRSRLDNARITGDEGAALIERLRARIASTPKTQSSPPPRGRTERHSCRPRPKVVRSSELDERASLR